MKNWISSCIVALAVLPAQAAIIYDNGAVGTPETVFYSVGPYTEVGDRIQLGGTARAATRATVELYNAGLAGSFDAVLRFYQWGAPVGASIGPEYLLAGVTAPEGLDFQVSFETFGLVVPDDLVFTLEVRNQTAGVDLGVNLYGNSVPAEFVVKGGSYSTQAGVDASDLFFVLEAEGGAAAVPEPATWLAMGAGLAVIGWRRRRATIS